MVQNIELTKRSESVAHLLTNPKLTEHERTILSRYSRLEFSINFLARFQLLP